MGEEELANLEVSENQVRRLPCTLDFDISITVKLVKGVEKFS